MQHVGYRRLAVGATADGEVADPELLAAELREFRSALLLAVRVAGLRLLGIDVKALSLVRSTLPATLFEDEGAILLLDVGTEATNLVVAQGGGPTLTRFIPGGSVYLG